MTSGSPATSPGWASDSNGERNNDRQDDSGSETPSPTTVSGDSQARTLRSRDSAGSGFTRIAAADAPELIPGEEPRPRKYFCCSNEHTLSEPALGKVDAPLEG